MSRILEKLIPIVIDGSMTEDITSKVLHADQSRTVGIQIIFTDTPTGQFFVEASNNKTDWTNLPFVEGDVLAEGAADNHALTLKEYPYQWIRARYVFGSGTGTLNIIVKMKG